MPRVFFGMDPNLRYGGEALFLIGVAARLIIWLVRTTRELDANQDIRSIFSLPRGPASTTTFSLSSGSGPTSTTTVSGPMAPMTPDQLMALIAAAAGSQAAQPPATAEHRDQQVRTLTMTTSAQGSPAAAVPAIPEHHCPKCGAQIHADIVHGGFGSCRRCGWTSDQK